MNKNKTACILVEDKKTARNLIESYIEEQEELTLLCSFTQMSQAIDLAKNNPSAILLLDIVLKDENSISIVEQHNLVNPIMFITAHKEFAFKAFQMNAFDYILKPVTRLQFEIAITKLIQRIKINQQSVNSKPFLNIIEKRVVVKVFLEDLLFIESDKEYCQVYTLSGEFRTKMTLKKVESILCASHFSRIHKSFIVNTHFINRVHKDEVVLNRNYHIPIGRSYKTNVRKFLL